MKEVVNASIVHVFDIIVNEEMIFGRPRVWTYDWWGSISFEWKYWKLLATRKEASGEDFSISYHKDWCHEFNYGINNFGVNPRNFPISKIRCDVSLHLVFAIAQKCMHGIRNYVNKYENKDHLFDYFDELWKNTCHSNQFRYHDVCSRIDVNHVNYFIMNTVSLVSLIKESYKHAMYLQNLCYLLLLLPGTLKFWRWARIESKEMYQSQIDKHVNNMNLFYDCGSKSILTDTVTGHGKNVFLMLLNVMLLD